MSVTLTKKPLDSHTTSDGRVKREILSVSRHTGIAGQILFRVTYTYTLLDQDPHDTRTLSLELYGTAYGSPGPILLDARHHVVDASHWGDTFNKAWAINFTLGRKA